MSEKQILIARLNGLLEQREAYVTELEQINLQLDACTDLQSKLPLFKRGVHVQEQMARLRQQYDAEKAKL